MTTVSPREPGRSGSWADHRDGPFPCLDAFRALAAAAVVAAHVAFWTGRGSQGPFAATLARLDVGVAIFFVLSGFLLFRPWASAACRDASHPSTVSHPDTAGYLWRRALRILPAYWLVVVACLLFLPDNADQRGALDWFRHLTLTQVYGLGWQRHGLTQTWSLCTEVAFYLALPLLAVIVLGKTGWHPRAALAALSAALVVSVGWHLIVGQWELDARVAGQWLPGYLGWFAAGMAMAVVSVQIQHRSGPAGSRWRLVDEVAAAPWACWVAAAAFLAVAATPLAGPRDLASPTGGQAVAKNLLYLAVAVLVLLPGIFGPQHEGVTRRLLSSRPAQWLGEISYGVFLWHLFVLEGVVRLLDLELFTGSWTQVFVLTWAGSVCLAAASYYLLERPILRRRDTIRRLGSRLRSTPARETAHSA